LATSGVLSEMTMEEVRALDPQVVLLGVASTEPHGPILPYGTDFFQCDGLCRRAVIRANEAGGRVLMYPTLPIGNNVNFKGFPFACRIGVRTLMRVVLDIIAAVEEDGIGKVVIVSGHGGNTDALRAVLREHFDRTPAERRAFVCLAGGGAPPAGVVEEPSPHGGESETSRIMYLRPDLVRTERLRNLPLAETIPEFPDEANITFVRPWHLYVPMGGGGETRKATAEKGRILIERGAETLADLLVRLSRAPWNPNFPYPPD